MLTEDGSTCIAINFDLLEDIELENGALLEPDNPEIYFELFQEMEKEWRNRRVGYYVKCMSILYNIIALLVTAASMQNAPQYKYKCLKKAIVYLEDHYTDNTLNIGALAAKCSMSEAYFRRCFKEAYRMSPNQYIKTLRMNRAKDLLKTGLLSISEVAEQVGFARAGRAAALIHAADGVFRAQHDRAAGRAAQVVRVADTNPTDRRKGTVGDRAAGLGLGRDAEHGAPPG